METTTATLVKADAKKQTTAPLINSNDVRRSNKEILDQAKADAKVKANQKELEKSIAADQARTAKKEAEALVKATIKAKGKVLTKATPTVKATPTAKATPLSKMTIKELNKIKGTIADVQWNKYFKMAGGVSGKPIKKVTPVKATKASPATKVVSGKLLAEYSLDALLAEVKRRFNAK